MADVADSTTNRRTLKRPQLTSSSSSAAAAADSEVLMYLMSQKRVRRAVELDNAASSPDELEASRLLLLSSIGHALLDTTQEENNSSHHQQQHSNSTAAVVTGQGPPLNNREHGFVMPLKRKPLNGAQHKDANAAAAAVSSSSSKSHHSANSRDLMPHELPPEAFGQYPSLDINSAGYLSETREPMDMSIDTACSQTNTVLHLARSPPAAYDDLYGSTPPTRHHTKKIQSTIQFHRPSNKLPIMAGESELPRKPAVEPPTKAPAIIAEPPLKQQEKMKPLEVSQEGRKPDRSASEPQSREATHDTVNEDHVEKKMTTEDVIKAGPVLGNNTAAATVLPQKTSLLEQAEAGSSNNVCADLEKPAADKDGTNNRQEGEKVMDDRADDDGMHGLIECGDGDKTVLLGTISGGLSPMAMGLIEDYVPGIDVIDLEDYRDDEQRLTESSRQRSRPLDELMVKLSEEDEALLFEEAPKGPKVELKESVGEQGNLVYATPPPTMVIDLDEDEDGDGGQGSPRGSAYSVISSMDGGGVPFRE